MTKTLISSNKSLGSTKRIKFEKPDPKDFLGPATLEVCVAECKNCHAKRWIAFEDLTHPPTIEYHKLLDSCEDCPTKGES